MVGVLCDISLLAQWATVIRGERSGCLVGRPSLSLAVSLKICALILRASSVGTAVSTADA